MNENADYRWIYVRQYQRNRQTYFLQPNGILTRMTSVYIAAGIIIVLIMVLCYAFMVQTVAKKREQQLRMIQVLEQRIKNFCILTKAFPPGFLSKELELLIYQQLIDATNQLIELAPKEKKYSEELEVYTREQSELQRKPPQHKRVKLSSPKQAKEVKVYLNELNKFIHRLNQRNKLSNNEFNTYTAQIKQLVLHIAVDNYVSHARAAETANKPRMALHYFTLAKNLMLKESTDKNQKFQLDQINNQIERLEELTAVPDIPEEDSTAQGGDWDQFKSEDDGWKKKAIYDWVRKSRLAPYRKWSDWARTRAGRFLHAIG